MSTKHSKFCILLLVLMKVESMWFTQKMDTMMAENRCIKSIKYLTDVQNIILSE